MKRIGLIVQRAGLNRFVWSMIAAISGAMIVSCGWLSASDEMTGWSVEQWREALRPGSAMESAKRREQVEAGLQHPSTLVRRMAAYRLLELGPEHADLKMAGLRHDDPYVRSIVLDGTQLNTLDKETFLALLVDPDPWVRSRILQAVAQLDKSDPAACMLLEEAIWHAWQQPGGTLHHLAYALLFDWPDRPESFDEIVIAGLDASDPNIRTLAKRATWPFRSSQRPIDSEAELMSTYSFPQQGWSFRRDPEEIGHKEGWFDPDLREGQEWGTIDIGFPWQDQGHMYVGTAWYRKEVEIPAEFDGTLGLYFDGVDESAWVWVNGEYAGDRDIGPTGWNLPFMLNVTDLVKPGEVNQITVRAMNTTALGGIYGAIELRGYR